jgi:hypothetical protein
MRPLLLEEELPLQLSSSSPGCEYRPRGAGKSASVIPTCE